MGKPTAIHEHIEQEFEAIIHETIQIITFNLDSHYEYFKTNVV